MNINAFNAKVFQNEVQCETAVIMDEIDALQKSYTDVQNGTSIDVAFAYKITDMSDLTLELSELISFEDPISTVISLQ